MCPVLPRAYSSGIQNLVARLCHDLPTPIELILPNPLCYSLDAKLENSTSTNLLPKIHSLDSALTDLRRGMDDSIYDNLPDDREQAFLMLESRFKSQFEADVERIEDGDTLAYYRQRYCNQVIAAAKSLEIEHIRDYSLPTDESSIWAFFSRFEIDVMNLIIQIRINHGRRRKKYSVVLDATAKQKIRHYIEQIRDIVEQSDLPQNKRDVVFKKLSELTLEIDRDRTRFEIVADSVRGFARLSGDVEREGAEPWWKWVKLILGEIDEAKEKEPPPSIPAPEERKRLEPPRKEPPAPSNKSSRRDLDDDIPF